MKVLVTGGAGFIGSHLVDALIARGDEVLVWDNLRTGDDRNVPKGVPFRTNDVTKPGEWEDVPGQASVDAVIHAAGVTKVAECESRVSEAMAVNVGGAVNVMRAFPRARFVLLSSLGALFPSVGNYSSFRPAPVSAYGMSKLAIEQLVQLRENSAIVRIANAYGPRQRADSAGGVVSSFLDRARKGQVLEVFGDGKQVRDFVHVLDVCSSVLRVLRYPPALCDYEECSTGIAYSICDLVDMIRKSGVVASVRFEKALPNDSRHSRFRGSFVSFRSLPAYVSQVLREAPNEP